MSFKNQFVLVVSFYVMVGFHVGHQTTAGLLIDPKGTVSGNLQDTAGLGGNLQVSSDVLDVLKHHLVSSVTVKYQLVVMVVRRHQKISRSFKKPAAVVKSQLIRSHVCSVLQKQNNLVPII